MRVRITQAIQGSIDGIQLDHFKVGALYDVSVSLACYLLAIEAAEPVAEDCEPQDLEISTPATVRRRTAQPGETPRRDSQLLQAQAAHRSKSRPKKGP
jgi:hypothetical protein